MSVTGDADLDHLVKLLSAEHLHCEVAIVPLLLINILEEILWDYCKCTVSDQTFSVILASLHRSCLKHVLLYNMPGAFLSFLLYLLTGILW